MGTSLLQLLGLFLGLDAAFFISKANLGLTPERIADLAGTYYGSNAHLLRSLAAQNADNSVGALLLVLSVALQASAVFLPQFRPSPPPLSTVVIAAIVGTAAFGACYLGAMWRPNRLAEMASQVIEGRRQGHAEQESRAR